MFTDYFCKTQKLLKSQIKNYIYVGDVLGSPPRDPPVLAPTLVAHIGPTVWSRRTDGWSSDQL